MVDAEQSIAQWRQQMLVAGIKSLALDELESHLREEFAAQIKLGSPVETAFETAVRSVGEAREIKAEFVKMGAEWNRPLAWTAWISFAVSFVLPSYADGRGWQCAGLSATAIAWKDFWSNWMNIHLGLLTLANLLMVSSMFLIPRFSHKPVILRWLRVFTFAALVLVWSFVLPGIVQGDSDLKIGCYVWSASFLLLFLSTFPLRNRKVVLAN